MVEDGHRKLLGPREIRDLARRHGFSPSKALGQNFVVDQNTIRRIVRLAEIAPTDRVVEIGAGVGTLTLALAGAAASVIAVEIDRKLVPALEEVLGGAGNVELVVADALQVDYRSLLKGDEARLVANLPYNIATPLVAKLLEEVREIADLVIMVQREVAERFVAPPGSRTYGGISVLIAYHCDARLLGKIPSSVFWPVPKVESLLVRLTRRPPPVEVGFSELKPVVRAAFGQRRKTLRNSLAAGLELHVSKVEAAIRGAGLDPDVRAETLTLEEFAKLAEELS